MPHTTSWLATYAVAQLGKPYVFGAKGYEAISEREKYTEEGLNKGPNPYYQKSVKMHDCSGLVYAALCCDTLSAVPDESKNGGVAHYAQTQFTTNCTRKGQITPEAISALPRGALVFKGSVDNIYHVGIYVGPITWKNRTFEHGVVEAMGSAWGVTITDVAKWRWWGLLDCCEVNTGNTNLPMLGSTSSNIPATDLSPSNVAGGNSVTTQQTGTDAAGNPIYTTYTTGENFTPYIATVAPDMVKVDYVELVNNKVSGMMFYAGWLYNNHHKGHVPRDTYINPYLEEQISECNEAELPYALCAIVRSKSRIEADAECRRLYYIVAKFPPKLGLWLFLDMHNFKTINEEILDCYYKYITEWGLGARCGLYVDKSRLTQIDWNKYQNKFHLWLVDHVDQTTLDNINSRVLYSSFFEVE